MPVKTKWAGYVRATIRSFHVRTTSQGEAQNSSIKSDNGIKANMTICRTAEAINMKADNSYKVKKMESTRNLSTTPTWTISETSRELTPYAEGIVHTQYLLSSNYVHVRLDKITWLVKYKIVESESSKLISNDGIEQAQIPKFYRVYIVKAVRNMQLMCSCKFFERRKGLKESVIILINSQCSSVERKSCDFHLLIIMICSDV